MADKPAENDAMNAPLEATIRMLEERLFEQHTRLDADALEQLLAEGFVEFGASGMAWTRAEVIGALPAQPFVQRTLSDFQLRDLAEDVVLATYRCQAPGAEGVTQSLRSSIWRRQGNRWQLVFHQGTRAAQQP